MILRVVVANDSDVDIVNTLVLDMWQTHRFIHLRKLRIRRFSYVLILALVWSMWLRLWISSRPFICVRDDVFHVPSRQGLLEVA